MQQQETASKQARARKCDYYSTGRIAKKTFFDFVSTWLASSSKIIIIIEAQQILQLK